MKKYKVTYTPDTNNYFDVIVEAKSYTFALLEFVIKFPDVFYTKIEEVVA